MKLRFWQSLRTIAEILFLAITFSPLLNAFEFRESSLNLNGPARYLFEEQSDDMSVRWWSQVSGKIANKAFSNKHGRNFQDFPALLFNKSQFRVCHAFKDCLADHKAEKYNPLLRTAKLNLKADYFEIGTTIGFRWDMPLSLVAGDNKNWGKIGIRASLPMKRCRISKYDMEGVRSGGELQDVLALQPFSTTGVSPTNNPSISKLAVLIRLDFAEALIQSLDKNSFINYADNFAAGKQRVSIAGTDTAISKPAAGAGTGVYAAAELSRMLTSSVGIVSSPEGIIPTDKANVLAIVAGTTTPAIFSLLPADASVSLNDKSIYTFGNPGSNITSPAGLTVATDFYKRLADSESKSVEQRVKDQDSKSQLWLIAMVDPSTPGLTSLLETAKVLSSQVTQNVYEFLHDAGMDFETVTIDDIGDLYAEAFYEFMISDRAVAEVALAVSAPTGGKTKYKHNPYMIYAGNGGHWEVGPKGSFGYKFNKYASIHADAKYMFVLNNDEERAATFSGSIIKNFGPRVNTDVKWQHFVGNVDLNFMHPGTAAITATLGYQFEYKREEQLKYEKDKMASWLGKTFTTTTSGGTKTTSYVDTLFDLDPKLGAANTNAITHKVKFESSYLLSDWLEFFWGGAWAFAGKNSMSSVDAYAGFHVAF